MLFYDKWADGWVGHRITDLTYHVSVGQCIYYVVLTIMQIGTMLAVRNRRVSILESNPLWGPRQNLVTLVGASITIIMAIICLYGPALQTTFGTTPIPVKYWFIPFALAFGNLCMDELRKLIVRRYPKSIVAKAAW